MHPRLLPLLVLLAALPFVRADAPPTAEKEPPLSADDKKLLDGLLKEPLFDPKGAQRVRVKVVVRSVWAGQGEDEREGWLVAAAKDKPARVYFTDGDSVAAPHEKEMTKVDFVAACRKRYAEELKEDKGEPDDKVFREMRRTALGLTGEDDLTLAAWLYRLGEEELAAKALARARQGKGDPRERLRDGLAWSAFAGLVHAYMVRADEEALAHGERLLKLYPDLVEKKDYQQAKAVVEDLRRRQKKGTFGKAPPEKWPDGFDKWDAARKVAHLIDALDEVDARQDGQPGGVAFASDRRVKALIAVGDPAVPALIDAVEKDERLTRSVHFWRDFARQRTVLSVREAALTAVMSILRVRFFEPRSTGDNFTGRGDDGARKTAERMRAYWKEYGKFPFDERMMKVLTDPKSNPDAALEAAYNLAHLGEERTLGTTVWSGRTGPPSDKPNPAVAKFSKPTVAEAILAALDRELKAHDAGEKDDRHDYRREQIENAYLGALVDLGDERVAPELAKRGAAAKAVRMRCNWAYAGHLLGDPKPFQAFADDFRAGKVAGRPRRSGQGRGGDERTRTRPARPHQRRHAGGRTRPERPGRAEAPLPRGGRPAGPPRPQR